MTVDPTQNLIIGASSAQNRMAARLADLERRLGSQEQGRPYQIPRVTSWPSNPVDGQSVARVIDAANGIVWQFRYNSAEASYPWEFVGGPPLSNNVNATESSVPSSSGSYVDLTTVGPSLSVPLDGDYSIGCFANVLVVPWVQAYMSYSGAGLSTSDTSATWSQLADPRTAVAVSPMYMGSSLGRRSRQNGLTAGTLTAKYKSVDTSGSNAVAGAFAQRVLEITPIRCQ